MRHRIISISELNADMVDFSAFSDDSTNMRDINRMKLLMSKAIDCELTQRQRQCVTMYYLDNMKMRDIASALCVSPSTVTRHIKVAIDKLKNVAKYY